MAFVLLSYNYIISKKNSRYVRNNQNYSRPIDVFFHIYLMLWYPHTKYLIPTEHIFEKSQYYMLELYNIC